VLPRGAAKAPSLNSGAAQSGATAASRASWLSAPVCKDAPCCFLPCTQFREAPSGWVGVDKLLAGSAVLGADGSMVLVFYKEQLPRRERDVVRISTVATGDTDFLITADHRLIIKASAGQRGQWAASDIVGLRRQGQSVAVFDGSEFVEVCRASLETYPTAGFRVWFAHDASVLARTLPRRGARGRSSDDRAIGCFGEAQARRGPERHPRCSSDPAHYRLRQRAAAVLGVHETARGGAPASIGSRRHDDANPQRCRVCWVNHRHILNPRRFPPCSDGERCVKCHAGHPELGLRRRKWGRPGCEAFDLATPETSPRYHPDIPSSRCPQGRRI